jgi:hypothetical protein
LTGRLVHGTGPQPLEREATRRRENALTFSNPVLVERTESKLINTG